MRKEQKKLHIDHEANGNKKRKLDEKSTEVEESVPVKKLKPETVSSKPMHVTVSGKKRKPMHVSHSSTTQKRHVKDRVDVNNRELNPLASSKTAKDQQLVVGDALSTVLKLDADRLAAYSFDEPTRLQKFALYKEKMIEMGHNPDEMIDKAKSDKYKKTEEKRIQQGDGMCEQERLIRKEEKRKKRAEKVKAQITERKQKAAEKKAKKEQLD